MEPQKLSSIGNKGIFLPIFAPWYVNEAVWVGFKGFIISDTGTLGVFAKAVIFVLRGCKVYWYFYGGEKVVILKIMIYMLKSAVRFMGCVFCLCVCWSFVSYYISKSILECIFINEKIHSCYHTFSYKRKMRILCLS